MFTELNHVGIVVHDLHASIAFYRDNFGAREAFRGFIRSSETDVVYLQVGSGLIELLGQKAPPADEVFGISHIAFISDDLDGDFARLMAGGYRELTPPKVAGTGIGRLAFVESPGGARVELIQRDLELHEPSAAGAPSIDHFGVTAADGDAETAFFVAGLNMATARESVIDSASDESIALSLGDQLLRIYSAQSRGTDAFWRLAIRVDAGDSGSIPERVIDPDGVEVTVLRTPSSVD